MKTRDNQVSKVYAFDSKVALDKMKMTLPQCTALIKKVRSHYGMPMVLVGDGRLRRRACWSPSENMIKLPVRSRTVGTVLHELAHSSVSHHLAWHGAGFMRVYIDLLARYTTNEARAMRTLAKDMRISVARSTAVRKPIGARAASAIEKLKKQMEVKRAELREITNELDKLENAARAKNSRITLSSRRHGGMPLSFIIQ